MFVCMEGESERERVGRPKLPEGVGRSVMIFARVTPEEKAQLAKRAKQLGKSGSSIVGDALRVYLDGGGGTTTHKEEGATTMATATRALDR